LLGAISIGIYDGTHWSELQMNKALNRLLKMRHKLIRAYLKSIREPDYKSKGDYWPWIRIDRAGASVYDIIHKGKLILRSSPFDDFDSMKGDVAIIGSGPSVRLMRLDLISRLNCVLLNGAIGVIDSHNIRPLAIIVVDSTFIENRFDMLRRVPPGSNLVLTTGVIRAVCERDRLLLSTMNVYLTQNILKHVYDAGPTFDEKKRLAQEMNFSFDLDCGYVDGGTVMAVGIQLAHRIKAARTYLIGLDISNSSSPRFYETKRGKLKCGLADAYESAILPFMSAASHIFNRTGIDISNCSPTSRLPYDVIPYCGDFRNEPVSGVNEPAGDALK
jgi:hypothetical protein